MAEEVGGEAVAAVAAEAPAASLEQRVTEASAPSAVVAAVPDAGVASAPAVDASWTGVRDYLKGQGIDLPFEDDATALLHLGQGYRQLQERNYYADLGRQIAPHAARVKEFLGQKVAPAPSGPPAWAAPEFKKEWANLVERDENTGLLRSKAGYDPAIAEKVQAYADWRERFLDAPEQVMAPLIEARAEELIDRKFAAYQERQLANSLVQGDAGWLFQKDAGGRPVVGRLTPEGAIYQQAVSVLSGSIKDVNLLHTVARGMVENAVLRRQAAGQPVAPGGVVAAQVATGSPSVGASLSGPGSGAAKPLASQAGESLRDRLNRKLGVGAGASADLF